MAVYTAFLAIIVPFATMRYSLTIPICKTEKLAANMMWLCFLLIIGGTVLTWFVLMLFGEPLLAAINMQKLSPYWYLVPVGFLFTGIYEVLTQYAIRKKALGAIAKSSVVQKVIGSTIKVLFGFLSIKPLGLLLGNLFSEAGGISTLLRSYWADFKKSLASYSPVKVRYGAKRYRNFPIYRVPSQIMLASASNIPVFYYAWQFSGAVVGQIGWARTMLSIPVTFLCTAVGKAFFAEIAEMGKGRSAEIYRLTVSIMKKLFFLSLIPFAIVIIFGPWIFSFIFGAEWYDAGFYARCFSVFLILQVVYSPISDGIFNVFEKQSFVMWLEISRLLITVVALAVAYCLHLGPIPTILIYSIGLALQYTASIIVVFRILKSDRI